MCCYFAHILLDLAVRHILTAHWDRMHMVSTDERLTLPAVSKKAPLDASINASRTSTNFAVLPEIKTGRSTLGDGGCMIDTETDLEQPTHWWQPLLGRSRQPTKAKFWQAASS